MTEKAIKFIKDQLINAWEHSSHIEMYDHLVGEIKPNMSGALDLMSIVMDWYGNDARRNACLMSVEHTDELLDQWIQEIVSLSGKTQAI